MSSDTMALRTLAYATQWLLFFCCCLTEQAHTSSHPSPQPVLKMAGTVDESVLAAVRAGMRNIKIPGHYDKVGAQHAACSLQHA